MSDIPVNLHRKCWVNEKGEVFQNTMPAGEPLLGTSALLVPSAKETRQTILRIRRKFGISRAQLCVCLGIGKDTLRRWETGERMPSTSARRLIQLLEALYFSDESSRLGFSPLLIGRLDLKNLEKMKKGLLPSTRTFLDQFLGKATPP
jgi:DNA-binding transcriptional regulator YiaG